jgi:hypothetical protein
MCDNSDDYSKFAREYNGEEPNNFGYVSNCRLYPGTSECRPGFTRVRSCSGSISGLQNCQDYGHDGGCAAGNGRTICKKVWPPGSYDNVACCNAVERIGQMCPPDLCSTNRNTPGTKCYNLMYKAVTEAGVWALTNPDFIEWIKTLPGPTKDTIMIPICREVAITSGFKDDATSKAICGCYNAKVPDFILNDPDKQMLLGLARCMDEQCGKAEAILPFGFDRDCQLNYQNCQNENIQLDVANKSNIGKAVISNMCCQSTGKGCNTDAGITGSTGSSGSGPSVNGTSGTNGNSGNANNGLGLSRTSQLIIGVSFAIFLLIVIIALIVLLAKKK